MTGECQNYQVHFTLTDDGRLALDGLGEETEREIFEFCYSELERALADGVDIAGAVKRERERVQVETLGNLPGTEVGRRAKAQTDMPTTLVDRIVTGAAKRQL